MALAVVRTQSTVVSECYYDGEVRHENAARSGDPHRREEPA